MANISTTVDLVINKLSQAKYEQLCAAGQLDQYQLYMTDYNPVEEMSARIEGLCAQFDDYWKKAETSSASQLSEAFSNCLSEVPSAYKTYDSTLSSLSDDGYALVSQLSVKADISALDKKITIDDHILGVCQQVDLSIIKLSTDEYEQIAGTSSMLSNALYIVEGSFEDAYGRQIKNVAPGTDLSDAVNLEQLSSAVSGIQIPTDLSAFTNSPGYLSSVDTTLSIAGAAADAKAVGDALSMKADISSLDFSKVVLSAGLLSSKLDELVVNNVTKAQYDAMLSAGTLCSDQLYSIDSLQLDARDDWVINVKTPELSSDAANKAYVDEQLSNAGGGYAFDIYSPPFDAVNNMYVLKPGKFNQLSAAVTDGCVLVLENYDKNQIYKVQLSSDSDNVAHIQLLVDDNSATESPGAYSKASLNNRIDWLSPDQIYVFEVSYGNVVVNDDYNGDALRVLKPFETQSEPIDQYTPGETLYHLLPVDNACNYMSAYVGNRVYNLHMPAAQTVNGVRRMRQFKLVPSSSGFGENGSTLSILGTDIAGQHVTFRYKSDRVHICAPLSGEALTFIENKKGTFDVNFEDEVNLDEIDSRISNILSNTLPGQLSSKQDKLTDAQILAINEHVGATIVTFTDDTISSFNIVGELTKAIRNSWGKTPKNVKIGTSVTSIKIDAFSYCGALTSVTIPDSVTSIGDSAFNFCSMTSMTIPNSVTSIGQAAFMNCIKLTSIVFRNCLSSGIPSGAPWGATNAIISTWNDASQEWVNEQIPYTFNEASTTSCVLQDHAVNTYAFSGNVSSVTMAFPMVDSNRVKDFLLDVTNSTTADAFIELSGLDSQFAVVVKEDDDLVEMTTVAPDEMARFYITQTGFQLSGLPTFEISKKIVVEAIA